MLQIRLAKYNLEANKNEFDEYKQRAQKILSAKENLLTSLKEVCTFFIAVCAFGDKQYFCNLRETFDGINIGTTLSQSMYD